MYLTAIIDLFYRKVIGWSMSEALSAAETIIPAWIVATWNRPITQGLIFRSMSRKGNCWDNAVAESFFNRIKVEWIYGQNFISKKQAQPSIVEWIESWYNRRWRHSALGYQTIEDFKRDNNNF